MGLFLADGNCYKPNDTTYRISIAFNKNQIDLINEMKKYFIELGLKYKSFQHDNGYTLTTYNKALYELLIKCYDKDTKEKILPEYANNLSDKLEYVLEYWLKGDGWYKPPKNNRKGCHIGCSTSQQLALSMRDISQSLGKHSLITKNKRSRYGVANKDQYWVTIYDELPTQSSLKKINKDEITSSLDKYKKYHYSGITYNLEVEDDNTYIANGIVVHNCVMTLVSLSSVFSHVQYKNLIENYMETILTPAEKSLIDKYAYHKNEDKINYDSTKKAHKKIYGKQNFSKKTQGFKPWKSSPWN